MTTPFTALPVIDVSSIVELSNTGPVSERIQTVANQLHEAFSSSGFAYLSNLPLSFGHEGVFSLAKQFFALPEQEKMRMAKRTFNKANENTYRGYFPTQPDLAQDNLKEGFEIGSGKVKTRPSTGTKVTASAVNLYEANQWPSPSSGFSSSSRRDLTQLYCDLQTLSSRLLSLLALSLNKPPTFFSTWLDDSLSTLRLLHYPPRPSRPYLTPSSNSSRSSATSTATVNSIGSVPSSPSTAEECDGTQPRLSCTPHTDSGILTLLHQDPTGGLEVLNSAGEWIPAPYIPGTIVVNIGDLMAKVSGGKWVATMHRVRSPAAKVQAGGEGEEGVGTGRYSIPFFFEPGEDCVVRVLSREGEETGEVVKYGEHVREKMKGWVEFQGMEEEEGVEA